MSAESGSAAASVPTAAVFSATVNAVVSVVNAGGSFASVSVIVTVTVSVAVPSETSTATV